MKNKLAHHYRTALVTGASAGLGRAFSDMLLLEGIAVWGTARDISRLPERANFSRIALDLTAAPQLMEDTFAKAAAAAGGFDLVINNAGYGIYGPFEDEPYALWRAQLDAMLGGTLHMCHLSLRGMYARNRGALVNISSLAAEFPIPYMSGYNMVKAGLSALSESLMIEARGTKVIVLDFRPGDYRTDFNQAMQRSAPEPTQKTHREIVEKRLSRTWITLEKNLKAGPPPAHAANTLRDALLRGRSGVVRSGTFFQARLAPFLARLAPSALRRTAQARYFGIS